MEYQRCDDESSTDGENDNKCSVGDEDVDISKRCEVTENEILRAARRGRLDLVKELIGQDERLTNVVSIEGYTPLHQASHNGHTRVVRYLLNKGANMLARTVDGWTPFHSACYWNYPELVSLYLSCGMDINDRTSGNVTGLHLAAGNNDGKGTLQVLLSHPRIDVTVINKGGETAYELDVRGKLRGKLFEMAEPCFNNLRS